MTDQDVTDLIIRAEREGSGKGYRYGVGEPVRIKTPVKPPVKPPAMLPTLPDLQLTLW